MGSAPTNNGHSSGEDDHIRFIPLSYSYDDTDSHESALRLVTSIRPEWVGDGSRVEFVRFTDGITNTLLKAVPRRDGLSKEDADREAILLRAYGHGTEMLIDRQRETQNHELLMHHGLAPALLARFHNGMMYRFVRGAVTQPEDLRKAPIYRAVAERLAQWHATVPCLSAPTGHSRKKSHRAEDGPGAAAHRRRELSETEYQRMIDQAAPGKPPPNVWTVMQKWILALPTDTEAQRTRQAQLQSDLSFVVDELSQRPGLGENGLVFAHCDLLSGNVIVLPNSGSKQAAESVTFIDYEYATPSPAAFDLANHFAEWGGFDCDYDVLPTCAQRRDFIDTYVKAYFSYLDEDGARSCRNGPEGLQEQHPNGDWIRLEADKLMAEVDYFRGVPGLYWGIWSLIQATISAIDFDYASYAEVRLGEYYAWRAELDGSRQRAGKEMPLREKRWAQMG